MNKFQKTLGIGALVLALTGCCKSSSNSNNKPQVQHLAAEYSSTPVALPNFNSVLQLEGKIVKVQPSQLSYCGEIDHRVYGSRISATHEFEYCCS